MEHLWWLRLHNFRWSAPDTFEINNKLFVSVKKARGRCPQIFEENKDRKEKDKNKNSEQDF